MDESTRRRSAAFELRQRAADDLDEAARLDGLPALRLLDEHVDAIAEALGIPAGGGVVGSAVLLGDAEGGVLRFVRLLWVPVGRPAEYK